LKNAVFQQPDSLGFIYCQAAVFGLPVVDCSVTDSVLTSQLLHTYTGCRLFQNRYDLFFLKPLTPHCAPPFLEFYHAGTLIAAPMVWHSHWHSFWG
jgi:hypothetical protein